MTMAKNSTAAPVTTEPETSAIPEAKVVETPAPAAPIVLDQNLIAAIATAVAAALRAEQPTAPMFDVDKLGQVIGKSVSDGIATSTRRKVTFGEYIARGGSSVMHPLPAALTPHLKRMCYQNHCMIQENTATDEEITLLNQITHGGRYVDRNVEVIFRQNGSQEEIDIVYPDNDINDRMTMKGYFRTFPELLKLILVAQKDEREEAEANEQARREIRRRFGNNQATREAEARVQREA